MQGRVPQQRELQREVAPEIHRGFPYRLQLSTDQSTCISKLPFGWATNYRKEVVGIISRDHTKLGMLYVPKSQGVENTQGIPQEEYSERYCLTKAEN